MCIRDSPALEDVKLAFSGDGNGRPGPRGLFLRFHPQSKSEPVADFEFSNRERWVPPGASRVFFAPIDWQSPPPELDKVAAHRQGPQQYLLNPDAVDQAGFDRGLLPEPSDPADKPSPPVSDGESD